MILPVSTKLTALPVIVCSSCAQNKRFFFFLHFLFKSPFLSLSLARWTAELRLSGACQRCCAAEMGTVRNSFFFFAKTLMRGSTLEVKEKRELKMNTIVEDNTWNYGKNLIGKWTLDFLKLLSLFRNLIRLKQIYVGDVDKLGITHIFFGIALNWKYTGRESGRNCITFCKFI